MVHTMKRSLADVGGRMEQRVADGSQESWLSENFGLPMSGKVRHGLESLGICQLILFVMAQETAKRQTLMVVTSSNAG